MPTEFRRVTGPGGLTIGVLNVTVDSIEHLLSVLHALTWQSYDVSGTSDSALLLSLILTTGELQLPLGDLRPCEL